MPHQWSQSQDLGNAFYSNQVQAQAAEAYSFLDNGGIYNDQSHQYLLRIKPTQDHLIAKKKSE